MDAPTDYWDTFRENGRKIAVIRETLIQFAQTHLVKEEIEAYACHLIREAGGEPAFKRVPGYNYATCISVNDAIVHSIPKGKLFPGDLVTIDTGMYYRGTTSDTAASFVIGESTLEQKHFLNVGRKTMQKTLTQVRVGNQIRDLAKTMQKYIEREGFNVTRNLTGHGLGRSMHEPPMIPCFDSRDPALSVRLKEGMVLAIEVMYMAGDWPLITDKDGWTMRTADGSISAVFEEDVLVTTEGPELLTRPG